MGDYYVEGGRFFTGFDILISYGGAGGRIMDVYIVGFSYSNGFQSAYVEGGIWFEMNVTFGETFDQEFGMEVFVIS